MAAASVCFALGIYGAEPYFSTNFDAATGQLPEGWTCHGSGKTAKTASIGPYSLSELFPAGGDAYRVIAFPGVEAAAYSNSTTVEGGKVDEWLVSPVISIPEGKDALILRFDELAIGSIRPGNYEVYLSEGGTEPNDFATKLHSGRPKGTTGNAVASTVSVPVNGFGGKDVRLAFVNTSNGTFLLGFGNISIIDYNVDVTSLIPEFVSTEGDVETAFEVSITTPTECKGFVAHLYVDGQLYGEYSTTSDLSKHFNKDITFKPAIELTFNQKKNYKLEITPADSSLPPYTLEGSVTCAEGFPGVCVMEEATGTWCPGCVAGAVSIAKYSDDYPEQFFGIAVHENDPMTVQPYNKDLKEQAKISAFPSGWFNRTLRDDPLKEVHVREMVGTRLPSKITVDAVCHHKEDGVEKLTVFYSPQLCYETKDADLRAVAVITEDHCKGFTGGWAQHNSYSGVGMEQVGGEAWWPYFKFYSEKGSIIPAPEMEYNHVGWGIYNDYYGADSNIASTWSAYTPQQYTITFDIPYQPEVNLAGVQKLENTAITVILLDGKTGRVMGADRMEASKYIEGDPAGADTAHLNHARAYRQGDNIVVETSVESAIEIFDMAGICVARQAATEGICRLKSVNSPCIIRVTNGNNAEIIKVF